MANDITMDETGYQRLLEEIDAKKQEVLVIQQAKASHVEYNTSDSAMNNPILFEYEQKLRQVQSQLNKLLSLKNHAKIVKDSTAVGVIGYGSLVKVLFLEDSDQTMTLKVVTNSPRDGEVSIQSPIGKALYGHKAGDIVKYNVGECVFQLKVITID